MTKTLTYQNCSVREGYTTWKTGDGREYTLEAGAGEKMEKLSQMDPLAVRRCYGIPDNFYQKEGSQIRVSLGVFQHFFEERP